MAFFITLWIGNGAVKRILKKKKKNHGRNYLIFKILLIAIDWNF